MKTEGRIYQPYDQWETNTSLRQRILRYFGDDNPQNARDKLYGGKALSDIFERFELEIVDPAERIVNIRLIGRDPRRTLHIRGMSLRQLLVESTLGYVDSVNPGHYRWEDLDPQQRLEICQSELSRWSVVIKSLRGEQAWNKRRVGPGIELINADWCESIEVTNNCTTSTGFELKIKVYNPAGTLDQYHGSFIIPQLPYQQLSRIQAGAWARQGFAANWEGHSGKDADHALLHPRQYPSPEHNPTFGMVYWEKRFSARERIRINLQRYRDLDGRSRLQEYKIRINKGKIDYQRWGTEAEYYTKPHRRRLVINPKRERHPIDPPKRYGEILRKKEGAFKLPVFRSDGLYDVLHPEAKVQKNYPTLKKLTRATLRRTRVGKYELQLLNKKPRAQKELHRIVIGNLDLDQIPHYPNFFTLHRFAFCPRNTTALYDPDWRPCSESHDKKSALYAAVLAAGPDDDAIYIQPESWGIERAILSREGEDLVVDLISYERIVPVWQGRIQIW
ncbi:MAG: hypothetical protein AAFR05_10385 [Bacteroidota bacterium]